MTVFCTYCSAEKDHSPGKLPAIQRYRSSRVNSVDAAARSLGIKFLILSGGFGLVGPGDLIPFYSHLLLPSEVQEHAKTVARQLEDLGVEDIIFFTRSPDEDKNLNAYHDCLRLASQMVGAGLKFVIIETGNKPQ